MIDVSLSDAQLVSLYKNGNDEAFEVLVRRYKSKVFNTIFPIVKDRFVAQDLLQDTFIKCVDTIKAGKYNEEGKFSPWIVRIAHNLAIDTFRKYKRNPVIRMEDGSNVLLSLRFSEQGADEQLIRQEKGKQLRALIQQLPESQKEVLILRQYGEMSFQEIADLTGVSINTALGRMRYALINLRKMMEKPTHKAYDKNIYPR